MTQPTTQGGLTVWMEGKLVPYSTATVPLLSHSLHYGCAAFEGIRAYRTSQGGTALFRAEDHFKRFADSIRVMGYHSPYAVSDLVAATIDCIRANEFNECYVRPIAYMDDCVRGLKLPESPRVQTAITTWAWGKYLGDDGATKGIRTTLSTYRRPDIATALTAVKLSGNYLTSVLARQEATLRGYDEALLLDPQGFVAEGSGENLFIVKGGVLFTPPEGYILPGITRHSVMAIARDVGLRIEERPITRNELYLADEAFFTGTAVEVTPIREVDHHLIGQGTPGPVTRQLSELFFQCVRGELSKYRHWLTGL